MDPQVYKVVTKAHQLLVTAQNNNKLNISDSEAGYIIGLLESAITICSEDNLQTMPVIHSSRNDENDSLFKRAKEAITGER